MRLGLVLLITANLGTAWAQAPDAKSAPPAQESAPAAQAAPKAPEGEAPAIPEMQPTGKAEAPKTGGTIDANGPAVPAAMPAVDPSKSLLTGIIEEFTYDPKGKRDPFKPYSSSGGKQVIAKDLGPLFELQKFDLDQLKLIGVIWDNRNPKAMILDPSGKGHIVRRNERLGKNNGYIHTIREGELVVVESFTANDGRTSYQTKLIKLSQDE